MMYRRNFLKTTGLLSLTPIVPGFVNSLAKSTDPSKDQKILVVIELNGGNDGINTVVPVKDEAYKKHRKKLALDVTRLHRLDDEQSLHQSMRHCKELFDDGNFSIINGVGYPNPNRSHFESLDIWHRGTLEDRQQSGAGWLGHALDLYRRDHSRDKVSISGTDGYFIGRESVAEALSARRARIGSLSRFEDLLLNENASPTDSNTSLEIEKFVQRQFANAHATSKKIESLTGQQSDSSFPDSQIGQQLRMVAQLIKSGSHARVFYTIQGGYDTHSSQLQTHSNLLFSLSNAIRSFVNDLKKHGLDDRVVLLAFSEFGRRVKENDSLGTDHGTAGPVFLAGTPIRGGVLGTPSNLSSLVDGDLKTQFDFRQVYTSVLDGWLGIPSVEVLGREFQPLDLFG